MEESLRVKRNIYAFIASYIFMGFLAGACYDVLATFLQQVSIETAKSMSSYLGGSFFTAAMIVLLVPKLGYKKLIMAGPIMVVSAIVCLCFVNVPALFPVATLFIWTGVTLFDVMLAPYLSAYTTEENRQTVFSRTYYTNIAGMALAAFFGGSLIVKRFASRIGENYSSAKALTKQIDTFSPDLLQQYTLAQRDVLLMFAVLAALALIPLIFIRERNIDFRDEDSTNAESVKKEKKKFDWSIFKNKYVLLWLVYFALIRLGACLITPYFAVYLNKFIGIDRATTSNLISFQYFAMVIFVALSPKISAKFGRVTTLGGIYLLAIPFMLIIANGKSFGNATVAVVAIAFFMRSGLVNAANPIMNSLPMSFVSKELRPAYNSCIFVAGSLTSILAGFFTKGFLFKTPSGYGTAYYITSAIYITAAIMVLTIYTKKYNRPENSNSKSGDSETKAV